MKKTQLPAPTPKRAGKLSVEDTAKGIVYSIKQGSQATDGIVILIDDIANPPIIKAVTVKVDLPRHIQMLKDALRMFEAAVDHEAKKAAGELPAKPEDLN